MNEGPIGIAGTGRVAQALGRLLRERGEPVLAVAGRAFERTRAAAQFIGGVEAIALPQLPWRVARVIIAVSDQAVPEVAALLADSGMEGGLALHTCGALGPEVLSALDGCGVSCATLHPLQTIATPEQGVAALQGCAFGITGVGLAADWAERIARLLGGRALRIPAEARALYHAAAVMASNYVVALIDAAAMLMSAAGIDEPEALEAIAPLAKASSSNALDLGPVRALTGPVERGDAETVSRHLDALAAAPSSVRELYRAAGWHALEIARRRGLAEADARRLERLLREKGEADG